MSVNSINGVNTNAQQPRKNSALSNAMLGGAGLGVVGAGAGYVFGGRRPSIADVFEDRLEQPDVFTRESVVAKDAEAAKKLEEAVNELKNVNVNGEVGKANAAIYEAVQGQALENKTELDEAIKKAYDGYYNKKFNVNGKTVTPEEIKENIAMLKEKKNDITNNIFRVKKLEELLESYTAEEVRELKLRETIELLKESIEQYREIGEKELKEALEDGKELRKVAKEERSALAKAEANQRKARMDQFMERAKVESNVEHGLVDTLANARNKLSDARVEKMKEIFARDEIKQAFEKIKGAFPKEGQGKMAAIVGGIAAAVGLIGGYFMNNSHNDNA